MIAGQVTAQDYLDYLWGVWTEDNLVRGPIQTTQTVVVTAAAGKNRMQINILVNGSYVVYMLLVWEGGNCYARHAGFLANPYLNKKTRGRWYRRLLERKK